MLDKGAEVAQIRAVVLGGGGRRFGSASHTRDCFGETGIVQALARFSVVDTMISGCPE
jgi:hypothetical protein